jgi:hypothetical protein
VRSVGLNCGCHFAVINARYGPQRWRRANFVDAPANAPHSPARSGGVGLQALRGPLNGQRTIRAVVRHAVLRASAPPVGRRDVHPFAVVLVRTVRRYSRPACDHDDVEGRMAGKFEVYEDRAGKYRFRLKASNGQVVATGEA